MSLCFQCSNIPRRLFQPNKGDNLKYEHHGSFERLRTSADEGCPLCKLFLHVAGHIGNDKYYRERGLNLYPDHKGCLKLYFGVKVGFIKGSVVPKYWRDIAVPSPSEMRDEQMRLAWEAKVMKRWVTICQEDHHATCGWSSGYVPTRLIEVGADHNRRLRLFTTLDRDSDFNHRYVALSHCWGKTMPGCAQTTLQTLDSHHRFIDYDGLPNTFRDSIGIVRRLGIHYVWIDSLCIIQDSISDWDREAAQMSEIYSNSYLTLAASSSSDGVSGCRVQNPGKQYGAVEIPCPGDRPALEDDLDGAKKTFKHMYVGEYNMEHHTFVVDGPTETYRVSTYNFREEREILSDGPLARRGWTLQEAMLSPRIAHFCDSTIVWECKCARACTLIPWDTELEYEDVTGNLTTAYHYSAPGLRKSEWMRDHSTSATPMENFATWTRIVNSYTTRRLTKQEDMLPALSGIARTIARDMGDEYLAGLWKSTLPLSLLWESYKHPGATDKPMHARQSKYIAPSWSWASVRGDIDYAHWTVGRPPTSRNEHEYDPSFEPQLLSASLERASDDPYGRLSSGTLILRAKARKAVSRQIHGESWKPAFDPGQSLLLYEDEDSMKQIHDVFGSIHTDEALGRIRYDVPLCEACAPWGTVREVTLICCAGFRSDQRKRGEVVTSAVAVEPDEEEEGVFRRVGVAWSVRPEFWKDALTRDITLI